MLDAAGGLPLGLTALAFCSPAALLMPGQRFLLRQPFPVVWAGFLLVVLAVAALRWLLASLFWGGAFPLGRSCSRPALTFAGLSADRLAAGSHCIAGWRWSPHAAGA